MGPGGSGLEPTRPAARHPQRGASALEFAILAPVLIALVFGMIDVGDMLTHRSAATSSLRVAAVHSFDAGDRREHDEVVLTSLVTELTNRDAGDIDKIVVYNASTSSDPPAACLSPGAVSGGGVAGQCVVYGPSVVASVLAGTADALFDDPACVGDADSKWCPATRVPATGAKVGIYVETTRSSPTGVFPPLREYQLRDDVVVHLWPRPDGTAP